MLCVVLRTFEQLTDLRRTAVGGEWVHEDARRREQEAERSRETPPGASGAGKSTVRANVAPAMAPAIDCVELRDVVSVPVSPTIARRQRATEAAVRRAVALQREGRHLLLSGDPVAAGEVLAAPSASMLDAVAVCLLDVSAEAQAARLAHRGDDPTLLPHHHAFADWMRGHAHSPRHMPHVLSAGGWDEMRWDRWADLDTDYEGWIMEILDTTMLSADQVAAGIMDWCKRALGRASPSLSSGQQSTSGARMLVNRARQRRGGVDEY